MKLLKIFTLFILCTHFVNVLAQIPKTGEKATFGENLPFPEPPSASIANETMQESKHTRRQIPKYLKPDAPNILIIMLDDIGFGTAETFGGEIHTPTLTKIYNEGIAYNRFHTTPVCSPTRASLLTGRNPHRVGCGTIAERSLDWDGYRGFIPKTAGTVAEVLRNYGYKTSAFGKWHNTPTQQTTAMGPFDYWPNGYGFDYFYGFLAGETSQYEPRLFENINAIEPPKDPNYHLTTDMTNKALAQLEKNKAFTPDKPFLMYFAPGAVHGPHHVAQKWADKYKGKFNDGWDAMRERVYKRELEKGWIPKGTKLTERPATMAAWHDIPENEKAFQSRLMENFAGFVEQTDYEIGRLIEGIEKIGLRENTAIFLIWGDNGSSAEGQNGTISELLAQNVFDDPIEKHIKTINEMGGLNVIGSDITDPMYHAAWAWAGNTPFKGTKILGNYFGGFRNPLVISWPKVIKPEHNLRSQFHQINDIVPTIYDILGITAPKFINGIEQMPIDGVSMLPTFTNANAPENKHTQYFDNNGSRGIYHDGWFAGAFGPFIPWQVGAGAINRNWNPKEDVWELYHIDEDFSQANDLAAQMPEKLAEMKALFLQEAKANNVFPIGGAMYTRLDPSSVIKSPYTHWNFTQNTQRMPEFTAPGIGKVNNKISFDVETDGTNSGVIYALGGNSGGISLYMKNGKMYYEYNRMIIERYKGNTEAPLSKGTHHVEVSTTLLDKKIHSPATVLIEIDQKIAFAVHVSKTVPAVFTASETFDVGRDLGSPVSLDYHDKTPFIFDGRITNFKVDLLP